jgi:hypothetical protein
VKVNHQCAKRGKRDTLEGDRGGQLEVQVESEGHEALRLADDCNQQLIYNDISLFKLRSE